MDTKRHQGRAWTEESPVKTQQGAGHLQAKGEASRETSPAEALMLGFQPPDCEVTKVLSLKPPSPWHLVPAARGN